MLVWIENAPTLEANSEEEIFQFVDQNLTCNTDNEKTANLVGLQSHKHSRTCRKKENHNVDLGFHCLHCQKQCCCIHLKRMWTSTKREYRTPESNE